MKKVFLLLTSALFGVAVMAGPLGVTTQDGKTILSVPWNSYGPGDEWQGGETEGAKILTKAFMAATGEGTYTPTMGDAFVFSLKGKANFTGVIKMGIIDERGDVGYWQDFGDFGSHEISVVAGEEFSDQSSIIITKMVATNSDPGKEEFLGMDLTSPDLVILCKLNEGAEDFGTENPCIITLDEFLVSYEEPIEVANPFSLGYQKKEGDFYQYQGTRIESVTPAKGKFVNVSMKFTPKSNIESLQFGLIDNSEKAWNKWWGSLTNAKNDFDTFLSALEKDKEYTAKFSMEIVNDPCKDAKIVTALFAESADFASQVMLDMTELVVDVTDKAKYYVLDVEEVAAADFAIEGGMVYSAGQITVYNVAGQVVATASQEFNVNTLVAGVYFIVAEEGTIKFVK
ncbi:MAG: T9SS type A sorting domain-containing protein [Bacteroidales bacterium]|nr:T9SS type A sorting domain-containing protein [Bacteroidales bacterium]